MACAGGHGTVWPSPTIRDARGHRHGSSYASNVDRTTQCCLDLPPFLTQAVKTQNPFKGELSHGVVEKDFTKEFKLAAEQRRRKGVPSARWHGRWRKTPTCCTVGGVSSASGLAMYFRA